MKRLFIAIQISEETTQKIHAWRKDFWERSGFEKWEKKRKTPYLIRFVPDEKLHITLVPPWEAENEHDAVHALRESEIKQPHDITFRRIEYGPDPKRPGLIWAAGNAKPSLFDLKDALEMAVFGEASARTFLPHITLARFKREHFSSFPVKSINEKVQWTEQVGSVVLMESEPRDGGRHYEVIEEISLLERQ